MSAPKTRCPGCHQPVAECEGGPGCPVGESLPFDYLNPFPAVPYDGAAQDADG